ncbi:MAG: hypothetical protein QW728_03855 [Thermoplasmata archaeon]
MSEVFELSKNELKTLYGLVRYPTLNDRELSLKIKLKMSTITAIKNRLKRKGYYKTYRVPILANLGCEILGINYTKLSLKLDYNSKIELCRRVVKEYPEVFYSLMDEGKLLFFSFLQNYTDAKGLMERFYQIFSENEALDNEETKFVFFPFEQARLINFFNYAPMLKMAFNIEVEEEEEEDKNRLSALIAPMQPKKIDLTKAERKTLWGLVKYPDLQDNAIAKHIDITRQSIAKMKRKFEEQGIIQTIRVPNLIKLGFELLIYAHFTYNPKTTVETRKESIQKILDDLPITFLLSSNMEGTLIGITRNYTETQNYLYKALSIYKASNFLREDPTIMIFTLQSLKVLSEHQYADIISKFLQIDETQPVRTPARKSN